MPELPEVKIMTERLSILKNKKLSTVVITKNYIHKLKNKNKIKKNVYVLDVYNIGQRIFVKFDSGYTLIFAPGMTGNISYYNSNYDIVEFKLFNNKYMYINDIRKIGRLYIMKTKNIPLYINKNLGYDPFYHKKMEFQEFYDKFVRPRINSRQVLALKLLDDRIFAGIGNYIRAEMIYDTKIDPFCIFGDLGKPLIKKLFLSFRKIVYKSYLYQKGKSPFEFNAYGRKDKKNIKRIVLNYRTFWYDPKRIKYKC